MTIMRKRYYSTQQINDDIDKWKAKARKHRDTADAYDLQAQIHFKDGNSVELAKSLRQDADKKRAAAVRIETRRLPRLKQKLAEFRTLELSGLGGDGSVER
jgi:hypothetical protein